MSLKPPLSDQTQTIAPIRNAVTGRKSVDPRKPVRNMAVAAKPSADKPIPNSVTRKHGK